VKCTAVTTFSDKLKNASSEFPQLGCSREYRSRDAVTSRCRAIFCSLATQPLVTKMEGHQQRRVHLGPEEVQMDLGSVRVVSNPAGFNPHFTKTARAADRTRCVSVQRTRGPEISRTTKHGAVGETTGRIEL